ncbi:hypothetical protein HZA97_02920 [Candidatus Woesearchaeota archaeon]|nr:hypothetical protein [Candidatus Woesearchaeota archaeon]
MENTNTIMVAVIVGLFVVAILQGVQLYGKDTVISSASVAPAAQVQSVPVRQASVPSGLQNLPSMVGGC